MSVFVDLVTSLRLFHINFLCLRAERIVLLRRLPSGWCLSVSVWPQRFCLISRFIFPFRVPAHSHTHTLIWLAQKKVPVTCIVIFNDSHVCSKVLLVYTFFCLTHSTYFYVIFYVIQYLRPIVVQMGQSPVFQWARLLEECSKQVFLILIMYIYVEPRRLRQNFWIQWRLLKKYLWNTTIIFGIKHQAVFFAAAPESPHPCHTVVSKRIKLWRNNLVWFRAALWGFQALKAIKTESGYVGSALGLFIAP